MRSRCCCIAEIAFILCNWPPRLGSKCPSLCLLLRQLQVLKCENNLSRVIGQNLKGANLHFCIFQFTKSPESNHEYFHSDNSILTTKVLFYVESCCFSSTGMLLIEVGLSILYTISSLWIIWENYKTRIQRLINFPEENPRNCNKGHTKK